MEGGRRIQTASSGQCRFRAAEPGLGVAWIDRRGALGASGLECRVQALSQSQRTVRRLHISDRIGRGLRTKGRLPGPGAATRDHRFRPAQPGGCSRAFDFFDAVRTDSITGPGSQLPTGRGGSASKKVVVDDTEPPKKTVHKKEKPAASSSGSPSDASGARSKDSTGGTSPPKP